MFLPNVGGLTDRKLHTASSLPLFFLLSLYGHVNLLLHVRMGTLIFLRGLSILLLGKSCQCPHTKVTLTYILASGCIGFPIVTESFCGLSLSLQPPHEILMAEIEALTPSPFPNTEPGQKLYKHILLDMKLFSPLFPFPSKKKIHLSMVLIFPAKSLFSVMNLLTDYQTVNG